VTAARVSGVGLAGRLVTRVVVKRNNPRLIDVYGHWWVEIDGVESYGWWPGIRPISVPRALRGVPGVLNGIGGPEGGSPTIDPHHGEPADHAFHPAFHPATGGDRTDEEIVASLRHFAATFEAGWRWSLRRTVNCRSFQVDLLAAAGLVVPEGYGHTGGVGCPLLAPLRRWCRLWARRWCRHDPDRRRARRRPHAALLAPAALALSWLAGRWPRLLLGLRGTSAGREGSRR